MTNPANTIVSSVSYDPFFLNKIEGGVMKKNVFLSHMYAFKGQES